MNTVRKFASVLMLVSILALGMSGVMMMLMQSPSFNIKMHPVHNIFAMIMMVAGVLHIWVNVGTIKKYFLDRSVTIVSTVLVVLMLVLFGVGIQRQVPLALQCSVVPSGE